MNETRIPHSATEVQSPWVSVAERAIVVSMLAAILAAVLWQVGVGANFIVVVCAVGASIAGWVQPAPRVLALQRVTDIRSRRTIVR